MTHIPIFVLLSIFLGAHGRNHHKNVKPFHYTSFYQLIISFLTLKSLALPVSHLGSLWFIEIFYYFYKKTYHLALIGME